MYIDVTAAVIIISGKVLMSTRPEGKHLAGFWEFPGGKVRKYEKKDVCIVREIKEELGVVIIPLDILYKIEHKYSEKNVRITFFRALPLDKNNFNPYPNEKQKVDFFTFKELIDLSIVPADKPLIEYLMKFETGK